MLQTNKYSIHYIASHLNPEWLRLNLRNPQPVTDGHLYESSYQITMHTEWMPVVDRTNNLNQSILKLLILINMLQSCCPRPSHKIASHDFQLGSWRDGFTSHDCMKYQQHNYLGDSTRCTAHRWEHTPPSQMVKAVEWRNKTAGDKN